MASPRTRQALAIREALQASDPSYETLQDASRWYPEEVLAHPMLPLYLLENPKRTVPLIWEARLRWMFLRREQEGYVFPQLPAIYEEDSDLDDGWALDLEDRELGYREMEVTLQEMLAFPVNERLEVFFKEMMGVNEMQYRKGADRQWIDLWTSYETLPKGHHTLSMTPWQYATARQNNEI